MAPPAPPETLRPAAAEGPAVLALDTASPRVSVAVARPGRLLAERSEELSRSSVRLLGMIDETLAEAGLGLGDLAGIVVLAGPGSFTGLRVGMATALGLHQGAGVPVTAVPTLETLAWLAPPDCRRAVAVVDVLRGEWAVQRFAVAPQSPPPSPPPSPPEPLGPAARLALAEIAACLEGPGTALIGFGARELLARLTAPPVAAGVGPGGEPGGGAEPAGGAALEAVEPVEPESLAPAAARAAAERPPSWDPARLTAPIYFRPPAATPPPPRRGGGR